MYVAPIQRYGSLIFMTNREDKKEIKAEIRFRKHVNKVFKEVMGYSKYSSTKIIEALLKTWSTEGMITGNFISNANVWIDKYGDDHNKEPQDEQESRGRYK